MPAKKRVLYFDLLNIAACLAVISLHHNGIVHSYSDSIAWKTALIAEVVFYWAVPIFLMLSGATLMNYRQKYDTPTFFRKRLARAVIPFLGWSAIVLVWKLATGQLTFETGSVTEVINAMLNYKMENIYWYFPFLFSVYLTMPLLSWLTEPKHRPTLWYAVLAMFVLQSTVVPLTELVGISWNGNYAISLNSYFIFVFLGYLLSTTNFSPSIRHKIYIAGVAGALFRYGAVYLLSTADGAKNPLFFNYGYFPSVLLACAVFVWAKSVHWEKILDRLHLRPEQIAHISSYSLGIYLTHRIVMYYELQLLEPFGITNVRVIWRTVFIPVTYLIALLLVALLKKIPVLRRLVP